ncbi:Glycoside hydrolase 2 (Mannanase, beta-galactosidase), partial [Gonapodya sp. JEL0774]
EQGNGEEEESERDDVSDAEDAGSEVGESDSGSSGGEPDEGSEAGDPLDESWQMNGDANDDSVEGDFAFADTDSEMEEEYIREPGPDGAVDGPRWKANLAARAAAAAKAPRRRNLQSIIYGEEESSFAAGKEGLREPKSGAEASVDGFFAVKASARTIPGVATVVDSSKLEAAMELLTLWDDEDAQTKLRTRFITGDEPEQPGQGGDDSDVEMEDLDDAEALGADDERKTLTLEEAAINERARKKEELKRKFDRIHDNDSDDEGDHLNLYEYTKDAMETQRKLNLSEFQGDNDGLRSRVEGYRAGRYLRMKLSNVPYEFLANFDPRFPVLLGGLLPSEESFGLMQVCYWQS